MGIEYGMPSWKYKERHQQLQVKRGVEILIKNQPNPPAAPTITCVSAIERLTSYDGIVEKQITNAHFFFLAILKLGWSSTATHLSLFLQAKVAETSFLPGASSNPIWAVALRRGQPLSSSSLYSCGGG